METAGRFLSDLGVENGASHSGHEANDVYLNGGGRAFVDVSRLSGFDHRGDGRAVARWDYDTDGRVDLAVVNANAPLLQVFHNEIAARPGTPPGSAVGAFVVVELRGGNDRASPSARWSSRDACGARVVATVGERRLLREHRCGEGLAAQNSPRLHLGLGAADHLDALHVRWPSGRTTELGRIEQGSRVRLFENPEEAPDGSGVAVLGYGLAVEDAPRAPRSARSAEDRFPYADLAAEEAPLQLYTSMATWCGSCLAELPWIAALRSEVPPDRLGLVGLPVDPEDAPEELTAWSRENDPAYVLREGLVGPRRAEVRDWLNARTGRDALPTSVVTDRDGRILMVRVGLPTRSDLRRLLAEVERR